ncbi:hypothetical protein DSO57_1006289 [Entomophthora muscae]|uniref:Uncharacterized protein n=1 Tax=Entomophthora muscae TaxID=34485 RepID=A0ACC2SL00_9FUNG|nr:hypothetical protein DSO57_1006289 [Entomophthora muscae]
MHHLAMLSNSNHYRLCIFEKKETLDSSFQVGAGMHHTQASQDTFSEEVPLYSDSFMIIYPSHVVLLSYYFPFGKPKNIQIKNILSVTTPEAMQIQWWDYMNWGRGFNRIWWAKDDKRGTRDKNGVIIFSEEGETLLKACSVEKSPKSFKYT